MGHLGRATRLAMLAVAGQSVAYLLAIVLARQLGVDPSALARWERGKGHPDASHEPILNRFLNA